MAKQDQTEHKGKYNINFTKEDWKTIPEQLIYDAVTKEGKPTIARTLGVPLDSFRDWFKFRKINIPVVRNYNYYNARKPLEEQGAWEDDLSREILNLMEKARSERLKRNEEDIIEVICPTCGKTFKTRRDKPQKYCSSECVANRIRSEEEKAKLSKSCIGREAWNKGRKMSCIEKEAMRKAAKKVWTKEKKVQQSIKQKEVWQNKQLRNKMSQIKIEQYKEESLHNKVSIATQKAMGLPEIKKKVIDSANDHDVLEKRRKTNLKKYGVNWIVQTEQYINAKPRGATNEKWRKWLNLEKSNTEFALENYIYDFKYDEKTLIEINPTFTHTSTVRPEFTSYMHGKVKDKNYHKNKLETAESKGYRCIMIWDWDDKEKILALLQPRKTIYARKCEIREVDIINTNVFLNSYHLQNTCTNQIARIGLYYQDELISLMTFGKPRYNNNFDWELLRLCTKTGYTVIGGAQRMFNVAKDQFNIKSIISYCDRSKFSGDIYNRLGFKLKGKLQPSKHWYNPTTKRHITNSLLLQRGFSQLHGDHHYELANKGESNTELMLNAGYLEVYDCGQATYVWYAE